MKRILLFVLLMPVAVYSQIPGKKLKESSVSINGISFQEGDILMLGTGSNDNGDFSYIYQPANYLAGVEERKLPSMYSNTEMEVKHFKEYKHKRVSPKVYAVVNFGGFNYAVDIKGALEYGELVGLNGERFANSKKSPSGKPTDKIGKLNDLKKLLDDGAITQQEYEKLKSDILNQ